MAVASCMGLGLGHYVTSPQAQSPADTAAAQSVYETFDGNAPAADASVAAQNGPAVIDCRGCGPTLEERRWKADMAGLDADGMLHGSSDPVVRDYQAQTIAEDMMPDAAPSPIHALPPRIARFAAGEGAEPAALAQAAAERTPPVAPVVVPVVATVEPRF
ncbi:hypothetical protein Q4610_03685 [Sphingobium sp. HBC34]|uniref:Uncharacterized protein n=1 Tax=Sphingobium cyanobacteriorum TaxID=3063954 RepID=A0ABT8ZHY1_9SPHN|nr:hypothetical protein [Sphingobium sp. HBC34]MDO7834139.1 hypothetical protein [Sphingobium sp. HBC34]